MNRWPLGMGAYFLVSLAECSGYCLVSDRWNEFVHGRPRRKIEVFWCCGCKYIDSLTVANVWLSEKKNISHIGGEFDGVAGTIEFRQFCGEAKLELFLGLIVGYSVVQHILEFDECMKNDRQWVLFVDTEHRYLPSVIDLDKIVFVLFAYISIYAAHGNRDSRVERYHGFWGCSHFCSSREGCVETNFSR